MVLSSSLILPSISILLITCEIPNLLKVINKSPDETNFSGLWSFMRAGNNAQTNIANYRSSFFRILSMPLSCLVMMLIAIPFVINGSTAYKHFGKNLFIAFLIGISYFLVDRFSMNYALLYHKNMALISFLPALGYLALAVFLLQRVQ